MLKEIVEAEPKVEVSVIVVWLPMVETDNEKAAREASRMFRDDRVRQFYDPRRLVGLTYVRTVFANCIHDALDGVPADHPLREALKEWAARPADQQALWDAALFYRRGDSWGDRPPVPARWSKQVAFFADAEPGHPSATFFHNDCKSPPVNSDWHIEVCNAMQAIRR